jgi:hypothetical protein
MKQTAAGEVFLLRRTSASAITEHTHKQEGTPRAAASHQPARVTRLRPAIVPTLFYAGN